MITMRTAYTMEIDEIDNALEEILGQLHLESLQKNSVGLLSCYYDFIETGFVRALCEKLPFDVIGMTTIANASCGNASMYALTLTVLTSDDVSFATALTPALSSGHYDQEIASAYQRARATLPSDPAFIISYLPYIGDVSGADLVKSLDEGCCTIPVWGSLTFGIDVTYAQCRTIWNGQAEQFGLAMLLVCGAVEPDFILTSIPRRNIRETRALITDSDRCVLKAINGMPPLQYLESIGIALHKNNSSTVPLLVYYSNESEPTALGVFSIFDDGSFLCGGEIPTGASVSAGSIDSEGILETARLSVEKVLRRDQKSGALLLPCVTRYLMLAPDQDAEMRCIAGMLGDSTPYMMAYSGGEVCPVRDADGKWVNRISKRRAISSK